MKYHYDVIVIGAGAAGITAAKGLAQGGKKVLLIERDKMGGDCTNAGCVPLKTLIHHAREYAVVKKLAGETTQLRVYKKNIFSIIQRTIREIRTGAAPELLESQFRITVIKGHARFQNPHTVIVYKKQGQEIVTGKFIILASGSLPRTFPIKGLEKCWLLTSDKLFAIKAFPKKLLIIGAGHIGCEMAQALTQLGTAVTMVDTATKILPQEEPEIAQKVQSIFERMGINIFCRSRIVRCDGKKAILETLTSDGRKKAQQNIHFDFILFVIGRIPNYHDLNLEAAGIIPLEDRIAVDAHFRTSKKHIFAIGDVSSKIKFTHLAVDQAEHVVQKILHHFWTPKYKKPLPHVMYMNEEIASVGLHDADAKEMYGEKKIVKISIPYGSTDRAKTDEDPIGIAFVIAHRKTGQIFGATLMGKNAGELISLFTLAIQFRITLFQIRDIIIPYPVLGEIYRKLSEEFLCQRSSNISR